MQRSSPDSDRHADSRALVAPMAPLVGSLDGLSCEEAERFLAANGFTIDYGSNDEAFSAVPVLYFVGSDGRNVVTNTGVSRYAVWPHKGSISNSNAVMSPAYERYMATERFRDEEQPAASEAPSVPTGWFRSRMHAVLSWFETKDDGRPNPYEPPKS